MRATILAVLRILIGAFFVWVGASMLLNQDLLYGGLLHKLNETGGPVEHYRTLFLRFIEFRETLVVYLVAGCSILAGVSYLAGLLVSLSSLGAAILVLNVGLASSSGNGVRLAAHVAAALFLLLLGHMGAGLKWGLDGWLIRYVKDWLVLFPLRRRAPKA